MRASPNLRGSIRAPAPAPAAKESRDGKDSGAVNGGAVAAANGTHMAAPTPARHGETIEQCILRALDQYFRDLGGAKPHQLHDMVIEAVERPLLKFALARCQGNQSAAADLLGINRNTLRKKLVDHGFVEAPAAPVAARKTPAQRSPKRGTAARKR